MFGVAWRSRQLLAQRSPGCPCTFLFLASAMAYMTNSLSRGGCKYVVRSASCRRQTATFAISVEGGLELVQSRDDCFFCALQLWRAGRWGALRALLWLTPKNKEIAVLAKKLQSLPKEKQPKKGQGAIWKMTRLRWPGGRPRGCAWPRCVAPFLNGSDHVLGQHPNKRTRHT